jgi:hypothetical protein
MIATVSVTREVTCIALTYACAPTKGWSAGQQFSGFLDYLAQRDVWSGWPTSKRAVASDLELGQRINTRPAPIHEVHQESRLGL